MHKTALALCLATTGAHAQETLNSEHIAPHVTRFQMLDDEIVGPGAAMLAREFASHHALLLGEYHGSHQISRLVETCIPILHDAGYTHLALEIGPTSSQILTRLADEPSQVEENLRSLSTRNAVEDERGPRAVIPFFENVEDAAFLAQASRANWHLMGIDQEFLYGYPVVIREMAEGAGMAQSELAEITDHINATYRNALDGGEPIGVALAAYQPLDTMLDRLAELHAPNRQAAANLRTSIEAYRLLATGDWWASNGLRIGHMKENLRRELERTAFDPSRDRLVVKIGGVHTGRGISLLRHYEIGNTVSEMMEAHGHRSLHVQFASRYWDEGDGPIDLLESDDRYELIRAFGTHDRWTIIDLRPLKQDVYYDRYKVERFLREWFEQHDLVLIPPTDRAGKPNRDAPLADPSAD